MATMKQLLESQQKKFGSTVGSMGNDLPHMQRNPTGVFQFDLASGGGFPRGRISIVYGPESSNKTNLVLQTIAQHQMRHPKQKCAFFDIENSLETTWAKKLGVDVDNLLVFKPDYAEQAVDIAEQLLRASDCGIVAFDSLAAMVTTQEMNNSADKAVVGGSALAVGKLIRKAVLALTDAEKAGLQPSLMLVNQTRFKVGVMYGNPETQPGGNAPKFASCMTARLYGSNVLDKAVSSAMPVRKGVKCVLQKWKVPILATHSEWEMVTIPHLGHDAGFVDCWNTVERHLREMGALVQEKKTGWMLFGEAKAKLVDWRETFVQNAEFAGKVRDLIVMTQFEKGGIAAQDDQPTDGQEDVPAE